MKNTFLKLSIISGFSLFLSACQNAPTLPHSFTLKEMVQKKSSQGLIKTLDFSTILATAYQTPLKSIILSKPTDSTERYFSQLQNSLLTENKLALMHPILPYKNEQGEERYLVVIETVQYSDGYISSCRACSSQVDLLVYKKQGSQYRLLNMVKNQDRIPSSNGHLILDFRKQLQQNFQSFGQNIMGSYVKATFSGAGGQEESLWYALLLPESGQLQMLDIGHAGGSTTSYYADRPELASTVTSIIKVKPNQSKYYPLEVIYTNIDEPQKPYKSIFTYVEEKQEYIEKSIQ